MVFIASTDGNKSSASASISRRAGFMKVFLVEAGGVAGWVLNRLATTAGPYGLWLPSTSAGQCGGECYTLAVNAEMGPVFHS